jgi:glycosyltransferase involved in cell wall biosynthesis
MNEKRHAEPIVAILIHDMFEDWLESVQVPLDSFCTKATGCWWFNYAQALRCVGVGTVLICTSTRVSTPSRFIHEPTGAIFWVLPSPKACKVIRWFFVKRFQTATVSSNKFSAWLSRVRSGAGRHLASYFSTPLRKLASVLRQERCSCVLVEEYEFPRFDLAVLLGWKMRVPVFGTFCGARPQGLWRRPLRPLALRLCAGLVICARCEAERVIARYGVPAAKVALMYYPLDFSVWHPSKKEEMRALLGIPTDAQVVLYHGAILLWTKGLAVLMEAWERICQDHPGRDLRLILIGTGVDAPQLSQILATKRLRGVQWLNQWVHDRGLIQRYLSAADVYVFPSRSDACPVSLIEAMACGLPVVASHIRGIPDLLPQGERSGGLLVPPGDVNALTHEVNRVLDDRGLAQELGRRALRHAEVSFSMEAIGKQLSDFLVADRR